MAPKSKAPLPSRTELLLNFNAQTTSAQTSVTRGLIRQDHLLGELFKLI